MVYHNQTGGAESESLDDSRKSTMYSRPCYTPYKSSADSGAGSLREQGAHLIASANKGCIAPLAPV